MQNNEKIGLLDYNLDELAEIIKSLGEKSFRAKQLYGWLNKGISFDKMSNIPNSLIEKLCKTYDEGYLQEKKRSISKDGTEKFLFELRDKNTVECVLMKQSYGNTLCISTQVGCKMGCAFCVSGMHGFLRNLTAGEILAQVIAVNALDSEKRNVNNIVLMGTGEPFDNFDNVIKFLRLVNAKEGLNIGYRNISLSTCGVVPKIIEFAQKEIPVTLAISLHAPNDEIRNRIMPISQKYTIHEVIDAAKFYFNKTHRRVIIEYVLLEGINNSYENALQLSKMLKGFNCHVNLIPFNSGNGDFKRPSQKSIEGFCDTLKNNRISATVRKTSGQDIDGACGQLRAKDM